MYIKLWFRCFIYCKFCGQVMACASAIWWECMQNRFLVAKINRLAALQFSAGIIIELIRKRKFAGYTVQLVPRVERSSIKDATTWDVSLVFSQFEASVKLSPIAVRQVATEHSYWTLYCTERNTTTSLWLHDAYNVFAESACIQLLQHRSAARCWTSISAEWRRRRRQSEAPNERFHGVVTEDEKKDRRRKSKDAQLWD